MEFGVHLPLMDFGGHPFRLDHVLTRASAARRLGSGTARIPPPKSDQWSPTGRLHHPCRL
jgi:hypothetical protein